jgi:hypothetical protein
VLLLMLFLRDPASLPKLSESTRIASA